VNFKAKGTLKILFFHEFRIKKNGVTKVQAFFAEANTLASRPQTSAVGLFPLVFPQLNPVITKFLQENTLVMNQRIRFLQNFHAVPSWWLTQA
jgi:hypothetical protein